MKQTFREEGLKSCLFAFLMSVLAMQSAFAQATRIDFEGLANGTPVINQYQQLGVRFSGATILSCDAPPICGSYPPFSGKNVIIVDSAGDGRIQVTFDPTVAGEIHAVSARITGMRNISMFSYNVSKVLLGSAQTGGPNVMPVRAPNMLLSISSPVERIVSVDFQGNGAGFSIDDFTIDRGKGTLTMSEWAQIGMAGLLVVLGWLALRRRPS